MHIDTPGVIEMEERNCRRSRPVGKVQGQLNNSLNGDGDDEKRLSFQNLFCSFGNYNINVCYIEVLFSTRHVQMSEMLCKSFCGRS